MSAGNPKGIYMRPIERGRIGFGSHGRPDQERIGYKRHPGQERDRNSYRERDLLERKRNNSSINNYIEPIENIIKRYPSELGRYFEFKIFKDIQWMRDMDKEEKLKNIIFFFLENVNNKRIPIQNKIILLKEIVQLIRVLNRNFSLNLDNLKIVNQSIQYDIIIPTFIQELDNHQREIENMENITNDFYYLMNITCGEIGLEQIFKRMRSENVNRYMSLKRNSTIRNKRISPANMRISFYDFISRILVNVKQKQRGGELLDIPEEQKISITALLTELFQDQTNLIQKVYVEYLFENILNQKILKNLQKKLTNMSLRYYLPISYLLTNRDLKDYTQVEMNQIIERVGERKGKQGFVDIHQEGRSAVKYLNMRINNSTPNSPPPPTLYKIKEGNTKPNYTRINNTIPTYILMEYIIHSYLYQTNPNFVSRVLGITYSKKIAQIHYQLIQGYNPKQLLSKNPNHLNPDENKLIDFIYSGGTPRIRRVEGEGNCLFHRWNPRGPSGQPDLLVYLEEPEIQYKFRIPSSTELYFPHIRDIYRMTFQVLKFYQDTLNFVHSDFGLGNMMFDVEKIQKEGDNYMALEEGFIKLVDFELSSIFIPFDNSKPSEKILLKRMDNNYSTVVRNFVQNADINPEGFKIYDIVQSILYVLVKDIYDIYESITPPEFIYTFLQYFGRPYLQIDYKGLLRRFHQLFLTETLKTEYFKNVCLTISRNYVVRNYVFFGILPRGTTNANVIHYLSKYNLNGEFYFRKENFILPPREERPNDIIEGHSPLTYSDLFSPKYIIPSFTNPP